MTAATPTDVRAVLARAEHLLAATLAAIDPATDPTVLDRPTPCAEWDLRALVTHTLGTAELFASVLDAGPPPAEGALAGTGSLLDKDVDVTTGRVLERSAVAWRGVPDMAAVLDTPLGRMPAAQLAAIATFSALVHGWDIAATLGVSGDIEPGLLAMVTPVVENLVPPLRRSGAFADRRPVDDGATPTQVFLASLGRDPYWTPNKH